MKRYDTPSEVSKVLARHCPQQVNSLLDPSVGSGALVLPFLNKLGSNGVVTCVDLDASAIRDARNAIEQQGFTGKASFYNSCFLSWGNNRVRDKRHRYDVVVMNPPFAARNSELAVAPDALVGLRGKYPKEVLFVRLGLELLTPGGTLIAIVPSSVVLGEHSRWLRYELLTRGGIEYVRELPLRAFPGVESRFYIIVFRRDSRIGSTVLCNHDVEGKHRIIVSRAEIITHDRLDFAYFESKKIVESVRTRVDAAWVALGKVALISRGQIASPDATRWCVHTTDFFDGFWRRHKRHRVSRDKHSKDVRIDTSDLLVARVGRNCSQNIGLCVNLNDFSLSDCVIRIRPTGKISSIQVLFALRVLLGSVEVQHTLLRGTGAKFLRLDSLELLAFPTKLHRVFAEEFSRYKQFVAGRDFTAMEALERKVRAQLGFSDSGN